MANNVTQQIQTNKAGAQNEYNSTLGQLMRDIESLNSTVNKAINDEIDRLIPTNEKTRILSNTSERTMDSIISALKPSDYFKITGISASQVANAENLAKSSMKPSELMRPSTISEADWSSFDIDRKKDEYYAYLLSSGSSKLEELIFRGMTPEEKRNNVGDASIYFDMLSNDEKLYLIAQYTEREEAELSKVSQFDDKLEKSQKRKDQLKSSIKTDATKLIEAMKKTIAESEQKIADLKKSIDEDKKKLNELETTPIDIAAFAAFYRKHTTAPDINDLKAMAKAERDESIKSLKDKISEQEADLNSATSELSIMKTDLNMLIKELEDKLASKDIYVGSQAISEASKSSDAAEVPAMATNKFGSEQANTDLSQKQKANNMLQNMMNGTDLEGFRDLLQQYSYEDLVAMSMKVSGPFNKMRLANYLTVVYNDMIRIDGSKNIITSNGSPNTRLGVVQEMLNTKCGISDIKTVLDMDLTARQIEDIQHLLMEFNSDYSNRTQEEKDNIDLLMQYVKIGMLKKECKLFKGVRNLFTGREEKTRLAMLTTQLEKHAENQFAEKNSIVNTLNNMRQRIKRPLIDPNRMIRQPQTPARDKVMTHEL